MVKVCLAAVCMAAAPLLISEAYATPLNAPGLFPSPAYAGCQKALPIGQAIGTASNVTIISNGLKRKYIISVPPTYNAFIPTPIILSYHGGVRTAEDQLELDELTNPEFNTAAFVVYPQGIGNTWQGVPNITARNDILFTTDILNEVEKLYCINPSQIYATGKSDGAGFNNVLACDQGLSKRIAAFAPVAGAYYINSLACDPLTVPIPCSAGRTDIPILAFHGGLDATIAYEGGPRKQECLPEIPYFFQQWAIRDGLSSVNVTTPLVNETLKYSFGSNQNAGLVELIYTLNGGHDWPSTVNNADNTDPISYHHKTNFNATPIILDFFKSHPLTFKETFEQIF